ncbi:MAG: multidrug effflux MFS transporter [Spongiibacteraceae bacterium]
MKSATTTAPIITLAALAAIAPFAVDAYLPAMPAMAEGLNTNIHQIELSLSLFLAGFAIGQLIGGPFSDHFGRRYSIFIGLALFALGTIGIIFSTDAHSLWLFRIIEALGAGLTVVNPPAIIRDLSEGQNSARNLAHVAVVMMLAPLIAPMLGMGILQIGPWQGVFVFLLLYCFALAIITYIRLPETRVRHEQVTTLWQRYRQVLSNRPALGFIAAQSFSYGGMFAFIAASPLVYMSYFGVSQQLYPFLFGSNVVALVVLNRLNVWLLYKYLSSKLLRFGQAIQILVGVTLLAYIWLATTPSLVVTVVLVIVFIGNQSFVSSNATACTIEFFPRNSGTAAALLGACSFMAGALAAGLVGLLGDGTPLPMAAVMCGSAILGLISRLWLQRGYSTIAADVS